MVEVNNIFLETGQEIGAAVTSVNFSPAKDGPYLLTSTSWDGILRVYKITPSNSQFLTSNSTPAPLLDAAFTATSDAVIAGGLQGELILYDMNQEESRRVGTHDGAVCQIHVTPERVLSGSWDSTVRLWDLRSKSSRAEKVLPQQNDVSSLHSDSGNLVVVATKLAKILQWDLRATSQPLIVSDAPMRQLVRRVRCLNHVGRFVMTTVEGIVSVEPLAGSADGLSDKKKRFAFKSHRHVEKETGVEKTFSVDALASLNAVATSNHIFTGGSDGYVQKWDTASQKRIARLPRFIMPVSSLAVSSDDGMLAVGVADVTEVDSVPDGAVFFTSIL